MTGFASKRAMSAARYADASTVDHIIELRKERDAALMACQTYIKEADYWRAEAIKWMDRFEQLSKEQNNDRM